MQTSERQKSIIKRLQTVKICAASALSHIVGGAEPSLDFQLMRFEILQAVIFPSVFAAMVMLDAHANSTVCFILSNPAAESLNCFTSFTYPRKKKKNKATRTAEKGKLPGAVLCMHCHCIYG